MTEQTAPRSNLLRLIPTKELDVFRGLAELVPAGSTIIDFGGGHASLYFSVMSNAKALAVQKDSAAAPRTRRQISRLQSDQIRVMRDISSLFTKSKQAECVGTISLIYGDRESESADFEDTLFSTELLKSRPAIYVSVRRVSSALSLSTRLGWIGYQVKYLCSQGHHALFTHKTSFAARAAKGSNGAAIITTEHKHEKPVVEDGKDRSHESTVSAPTQRRTAPSMGQAGFISERPLSIRLFASGELSEWETSGRCSTTSPVTFTFSEQGGANHQISSPAVAVDPDVYYILTMVGSAVVNNHHVRILVLDDALGIPTVCRELNDVAIGKFRLRIEFRSLHRSKSIRIRIEIPRSKDVEQIQLDHVEISRVGATKALAQLAATCQPQTGIVASMATVVGREDMLLDAVSTLYRQVDKIQIYLNGHSDLPSFLDDPRIELAWSSDYGDRGDSGKFFWADHVIAGHRLVVDDDFIFPTNFARHLVSRVNKYDNRALVGLHGIILRQPLEESYYSLSSRFVTRYVFGLGQDLACHALGTGAVCYDPGIFRLKRDDFELNNMADIWVMIAAQKQKIPLVAAHRPHYWLIDNKATAATLSIYKASSSGQLSSFNTSRMQTHITRRAWPITIQRRVFAGIQITKAAILFEAMDGVGQLQPSIETWFRTRSWDVDWVIVIHSHKATDRKALRDYIARSNFPYEVHIVQPELDEEAGIQDAFQLLRLIDYDVAMWFKNGAQLGSSGWNEFLREITRVGDRVVCGTLDGHSEAPIEPVVMGWSPRVLDAILESAGHSELTYWPSRVTEIASAQGKLAFSNLIWKEQLLSPLPEVPKSTF